MLHHRLIFGLLFAALFVGAIALDWYCSRGWPLHPYATPPGTFIALACVVIIPMALREMQRLLAGKVLISMRITVVAALLCMLWPWTEQVADSITAKHSKLNKEAAAIESASAEFTTSPSARPPWEVSSRHIRTVRDEIKSLEESPWFYLSRWSKSKKPHYLVPTILTLSLVAAVMMHSRKQKVDGAMANAGATLLAITYLGVLPGFFLPICLTHSAWMLLAIVAVVKSADIGAYTTGRMFGRHKLIPWLSPGKTVEGFFGGLVFSGAIGMWLLHTRFSLPMALVSGVILGAVGQAGDLLESLLKRDAGVKDSGKVPGFGGILDILDSPLLAAPAAYWLLKLVGHP